MVFDTGSADSWFFSSRTKHKVPFLRYYDGSASSTYQPSSTPWSIRYGKGAVSGVLAADVVAVANLTARPASLRGGRDGQRGPRQQGAAARRHRRNGIQRTVQGQGHTHLALRSHSLQAAQLTPALACLCPAAHAVGLAARARPVGAPGVLVRLGHNIAPHAAQWMARVRTAHSLSPSPSCSVCSAARLPSRWFFHVHRSARSFPRSSGPVVSPHPRADVHVARATHRAVCRRPPAVRRVRPARRPRVRRSAGHGHVLRGRPLRPLQRLRLPAHGCPTGTASLARHRCSSPAPRPRSTACPTSPSRWPPPRTCCRPRTTWRSARWG